jgi:hypothetical protein
MGLSGPPEVDLNRVLWPVGTAATLMIHMHNSDRHAMRACGPT